MRKNAAIELDVTKNIENGIKFYAKQFDDLRLKVKVFDGVKEVDVTKQDVTVFILKEDKTVIEQKDDIVVEENTLIVDLTKQATTALGKCSMEIILNDEEGVSSTSTVSYVVGEKLSATIVDIIKSEDDIHALNIIEEFIQNSNVDLIEIKEAIQEIRVLVEETKGIVEDDLEALINRVQDIINDALEALQTEVDAVVNEATEKANDAVLGANETLETINAIKEEVQGLMNTVSEAVEGIETSKDEAINEIASAVVVIEDAKDEAVEVVSNTKTSAVSSVVSEKDNAIVEMTAKKDALIEEIGQIEVGTVEEVEQAVAKAETRLQELTVQCNWDVKETATVQKEGIEAFTREQQSEISNKAYEHIERINNVGSDIYEAVEGLDANIDTGLSEINSAVSTGKTEINELTTTEINKIKAVGQEITDAVNNLEINTVDNIERINSAGESQRNSIESLANTERREINELASTQKAAIAEAGNTKLEEIDAILGVSKGEVEELLNTTRQEIQTHRTDIATRVNLGKEEINTLKDNSLNEMTTTKDNLIDEMLGAEVELKDDITTLANNYISTIDEKGTLRVDALQSMIDKIDNFLEVSNTRVETLDNKIADVDNKMTEIQPALNTLSEVRNVCNSLLAENEEANANIEELEFLHIESDTRIVELRRLIEEAKQYETILIDYISSKSGNYEEIEARLTALEELITGMDLSIYVTKEEFEAEINNIKNSSSTGYVSKLGFGLYRPIESENFLTAPEPTSEPIHTWKYRYYTGNAICDCIVYFYIPLADNPDGKYVYTSDSTKAGNITFKNLIKGVDYDFYRYQVGSTTGWVSSSYTKISFLGKRNRMYYHDFPIHDATGTSIIFEDCTANGLSNFDEIVEEGDYLIDMSIDDFNSLYNGFKIAGSGIVKGYLNSKKVGNDIMQTVYLSSHATIHTRIIGGEWRDISSGAISKSAIDKVMVSSEGLPEFLKDIPEIPMYGQDFVDTLIFAQNSTKYCVYRFLDGWTGKVYYAGGTTFNISVSGNKVYAMSYNTSTGVWNTEDNTITTTTLSSISVTKSAFKVYHNTMDIYTSSSVTDIYQNVTIPADGEATITNCNNATETGIYEIDVKTGDIIENLPLPTQEMVDEETQESSTVLAEDLKGLLQVYKLGNDIYQEITSNDNMRAWKRVRVNGVWSDWRTIITEAMFLNALNAR